MTNRIVTNDELQPKISEALGQIASIVKATLGPGGRTILIERQGEALDGSPLSPRMTKDGVSVALACRSLDEQVDIVMQTVKNICKKTNQDAGDGTTTAIVLGEAIYVSMLNFLKENKDLNPQLLREDVERASKEVIAKLRELAVDVSKDLSEVEKVATISANGDEEIGKLIADAFKQVGSSGVVTVDEGTGTGVDLTVVDGYQFDRGIEGGNAFFNTSDNAKFESTDVSVIVYDGAVKNHNQLLNILGSLHKNSPEGKLPSILLIANEFNRSALQFLNIQKQTIDLDIACVRGPHATSVRSEYYKDIAILTGAKVLGNGNKDITHADFSHVGKCDRAVVSKYKTTIYGGSGSEDDVLDRVDALEIQSEGAESPYDAQIITDRIASLTSGVALISVGGHTEVEIKEKYDRIEDALNAATSAMTEGIVYGGGTTLLKVSQGLGDSVGEQILKSAFLVPISQILSNIGIEKEDVVFNARTKSYELTSETSVIDPVKVTRSALANAVSIAGLLITCGGALIQLKR